METTPLSLGLILIATSTASRISSSQPLRRLPFAGLLPDAEPNVEVLSSLASPSNPAPTLRPSVYPSINLSSAAKRAISYGPVVLAVLGFASLL